LILDYLKEFGELLVRSFYCEMLIEVRSGSPPHASRLVRVLGQVSNCLGQRTGITCFAYEAGAGLRHDF